MKRSFLYISRNMSNTLRKEHDIKVSNDVEHTVGGCLRAGGNWCNDVFDNSITVKQYLESDLCVGTARIVDNHLYFTNEELSMRDDG